MTTGSAAIDELIDAFRDYVTDGVPSSGLSEPDKAEIRAGLTLLATELASAATGNAFKAPVMAASGSNVDLTSELVDGAVVDSVTVTTGDRVLLLGQSDATENGVYDVVASGAAVRSSDMDSAAKILNATIYVSGGSVYAARIYVCTNQSLPALGTDDIQFGLYQDLSTFFTEQVQPLVDNAQAYAADAATYASTAAANNVYMTWLIIDTSHQHPGNLAVLDKNGLLSLGHDVVTGYAADGRRFVVLDSTYLSLADGARLDRVGQVGDGVTGEGAPIVDLSRLLVFDSAAPRINDGDTIDKYGQAAPGDGTRPLIFDSATVATKINFGRLDASGYLLEAWTATGGYIGDAADAAIAAVADLYNYSTPLPYVATYSAHSTLYVATSDGVTRLGDGTFNAYDPAVIGQYIAYRSDRDGTMKQFRCRFDGKSDVAAKPVRHILIYGQSNSQRKGLAGGYTGELTNYTVRAAYRDALMFDNGYGGPAPGLYASTSAWEPADQAAEIPAENLAAFVPLDYGATPDVEWHGLGMADTYSAAGVSQLVSVTGVGGYSYSMIKRGTQPYQNCLDVISSGKSICDKLSLGYLVKWVPFYHGEADFLSSTYQADIEQLMADLASDVALIAGQTSQPIFLATQVANWCAGGLTTCLSAQAQLELHKDNVGAFVLVCPTYFVRHNAGPAPGQLIHYDAYGIRLLDEYFAKAMAQIDNGTAWEPLRPDVFTISGSGSSTTISITFKGRIGSLQWNIYDVTTNPNGVIDPGNYGFELNDPGMATITAVNIVGNVVQITCSDNLSAGASIAYAHTALDITPSAYAYDTSTGALTLTFDNAPGFTTGDDVTVYGMTPSSLNGTWPVASTASGGAVLTLTATSGLGAITPSGGTIGIEAGPLHGARGCLSDSDTTAPSATLQDFRKNTLGQSDAAKVSPLVNYCVSFIETIV